MSMESMPMESKPVESKPMESMQDADVAPETDQAASTTVPAPPPMQRPSKKRTKTGCIS